MPKIPDLSDLTKKLGLENIVDSVKGMMGGITTPAKPLEKSEIDAKFAELLDLVQALSKAHSDQAKAISVIHQKINHLMQNVRLVETAVVNAVVNEASGAIDEAVKKQNEKTTKIETKLSKGPKKTKSS